MGISQMLFKFSFEPVGREPNDQPPKRYGKSFGGSISGGLV